MTQANPTEQIASQLNQQAIDAASTVLAANPALLKLRPLAVPDPVSLWPLAPGWWVLMAVATLAMLAGLLVHRRASRRNAFHREATRLLQQAFDHWQQERTDRHYLNEAANVVRRTAITLRGSRRVARLTGPKWADELNQLSGATLPAATLQAITEQLYRAKPAVQIANVHQDLTKWLSQLKSPRKLRQLQQAGND